MNEIEISRMIPHRPPFVFIDKLLNAGELNAESSFTIPGTSILTDGEFFTEAGLIENIAQTTALHAGFLASQIGQNAPQGMIGGIKNLEIKLLPKINDTITTTTSIEHEVMNAKIVLGTVYLKDKIVAKCEIKVFLM